jgi:N-acetyl-1-D-myo-inositol-2-amino-2-deoxy-alpha-D-glucopyranoside deacetylase
MMGLLLVHAHPDDETLWTGGTISRYAAAGVRVTVVTCTLGEEGEVIPDELRGLAATGGADQLGGYRVAELRAACTALGVADHRFLGGIGRWRDSGMASTPANRHPRAFVNGSLDQQAGELAAILADVRPDVVVGYDPNGGYGHPDHIRAHQIMMAATAAAGPAVFWAVTAASTVAAGLAELAEPAVEPGLPFALPHDGELPCVADESVTTTVDIAAHLPAKIAAMRAHATQVSVWEGLAGRRAYALSDGVARPLLPCEQYILAAGPATAGEVRTDLFGWCGPAGNRPPAGDGAAARPGTRGPAGGEGPR